MPWPALPKRVEYAFKVLMCLAQFHGTAVRAPQVARCVHIPPSQAAKTLYFLTWAGLVRSRRGQKGGFWLAQPPERIRMKRVVKFFEPPGNNKAADDPLLRAWTTTTGGHDRAWENLTLADLVRRTKKDKQSSPYVCPETGQVFVP